MPPVSPTYPGVYIEEIPSGNRTIVPVQTSITAFVGRTVAGPLNKPTDCFNYADFERHFGGRTFSLPLTYAVEDFFLNGGSHAIVVRVATEDAAAATFAALPATAPPIAAIGPGAWGNNLTVAFDHLGLRTRTQLKAASATIKLAGKATAAGTIEYDLAGATGAGSTASVPVAVDDDAKKIATALAAALSTVTGISASVAADGTTVNVTAKTPGEAGNAKLTAKGAPPAGLIVTPSGEIAVQGGTDLGELDTTPAKSAVAAYAQYDVKAEDLFNVTITYTPPGKGKQPVTERYTNVSVTGADSPTRIDRVINPQSLLVAVNPEKLPWNFQGYDTGAKPVDFQEPFLPTKADPTAKPPTQYSATGGTNSGPLEESDFLGDELLRTGIYALQNTDLFNLLCIPPDTRVDDGGSGGDPNLAVYGEAAELCANRRAMLICDPPRSWYGLAKSGQYSLITPTDIGVTDEKGGRNAAVFFPFIKKPDPELNGKVEVFAPSGSVAGQFAETDLTRGVWKAPAGMATGLEGVTEAEVKMTDDQNGELNPLGINAIRSFPIIGTILWGSRTLRGADVFADDYKYIPVRRLTLFIEESLYRGTKWAVFEPNNETLWSQLRLSVGTFMADLSRQGAFYGYSVMCDKSTTLQSDIDLGIVNVVVAFAPVKPAEFVVLKIAQLAGQTPG